ncbi:MAG: NADH-quinone oxidoreductase subunit D [Thermoplasmatota archaeon]
MDDFRSTEIIFGPQHPGIHGNFGIRLELEGDIVRRGRLIPGYLHRAFEKLMEHRTWMQNIALVPRICVPDPDVNEAAYSMAVEEIMGLEVPRRAQYIRTIVLELSRIASHLMGLGGLGGAIGLYTLPMWTNGERDYILDLFEQLSGARIYHIYTWPGGVRWDMPENWTRKVLKVLDHIESQLPSYYSLFFESKVTDARLIGLAPMGSRWAVEHGVTGPNLRATGFKADLRRDDPYAAYEDLDFDIITRREGDGMARALVRWYEVGESIRIIREAVEKMPSGPHRAKTPPPMAFTVPPGDAYGRVESSKGEYGYYVVSKGGKFPYRVHVRGPSFTHGIDVLEQLLPGFEISDVALITGTLDVCPPDIDR